MAKTSLRRKDSVLGQVKGKSEAAVDKAGKDYYLAKQAAQIELDKLRLQEEQKEVLVQKLINQQERKETLALLAELEGKQRMIETLMQPEQQAVQDAYGVGPAPPGAMPGGGPMVGGAAPPPMPGAGPGMGQNLGGIPIPPANPPTMPGGETPPPLL